MTTREKPAVHDHDKPANVMGLLLLLALSTFMITTSIVMLGPILVPLAAEMHTSVAAAGQLGTVTALFGGVAAVTAGPVSDRYGRRLTLLSGLFISGVGLLAGALAHSYEWLLFARMLTGLGGAMVTPTCFASVADLVSVERRAHFMAWMTAASGLGAAAGVPLIAWIAAWGGWRTPFWIVCAGVLLIWLLVWLVFPRHVAVSGPAASFMDSMREVSVHRGAFWMLMTVNFMIQTVTWGVIAYLPAYLVHTYPISASATVLPLALMGIGVLTSSLIGGAMANLKNRGLASVCALTMGGLLATGVYVLPVSPWASAAMAAVGVALMMASQPMILTLLVGLAGCARGTATGLFATGNQLGAMGGTGLGGLLLTLGGFPSVGFGCLVVALSAAVMMRRTSLDLPEAAGKSE